jgi:hypothetical protein
MAWSFTSAVAANPYVFCALFLRRKSGGEEEGLIRPFGWRAAPPRRVLSISMKSWTKMKSEGGRGKDPGKIEKRSWVGSNLGVAKLGFLLSYKKDTG